MTIWGLGLGSIEVGGNALIIELHTDSNAKGRYLLLLRFFHNLGSMSGPIVAGQLINESISWKNTYQYSALLVVLLIVFFVFVRIP